jgi:truncated hemoglobin YjbI
MSLFDTLGGEVELRRVVGTFVDRVFSDVMIGFIFAGRDRARIKEMEYQLAAEQLGGPVVYGGRPIGAVHAPLPIMGGHFDRRRQILIDTLQDHGVPAEIRDSWIAHVDSLRHEILGDTADPHHCDHAVQAQRGPDDDPSGES